MTINAEQLVAGVETLMSLPAAYLQVKRVIEDPRSSTHELAIAISADPALTARVLRLVNSPLYGFSGKIETVSRALVVLGTQQVHDLALATSVAGLFSRVAPRLMDTERFWRESVYCALSARVIAKLCNLLDSERLFVAGLLHAIGHLVMYQRIPDHTLAARRHAMQGNIPIFQAERELIGCDYAKVGATLMRRWNLPPSLCDAVQNHVDPRRSTPPALVESILHISYWLMLAVLDNTPQTAWTQPVVSDAWGITGLTPECYSTVRVQADAQLADTLAMLEASSKVA